MSGGSNLGSTVTALLIRTLDPVYGASPYCELRVKVTTAGRHDSDDDRFEGRGAEKEYSGSEENGSDEAEGIEARR